MYRIQHRRIRTEQLVLNASLGGGIGPEVLQKVDPPRKPMPPHENLVQETLIAAVVGDDLFPTGHQQAERAVRRLNHHYTGVEDGSIVTGG